MCVTDDVIFSRVRVDQEVWNLFIYWNQTLLIIPWVFVVFHVLWNVYSFLGGSSKFPNQAYLNSLKVLIRHFGAMTSIRPWVVAHSFHAFLNLRVIHPSCDQVMLHTKNTHILPSCVMWLDTSVVMHAVMHDSVIMHVSHASCSCMFIKRCCLCVHCTYYVCYKCL